MKKVALILLVLISSCGTKQKTPKAGIATIAAVYKHNGYKTYDLLIRQINVDTFVDTESGKKVYKIDTLWGYKNNTPIIDTITKKQKLDSLGRPVFSNIPPYMQINKDSVNWHIEGIAIEELLK